jgi:hypothetical protein
VGHIGVIKQAYLRVIGYRPMTEDIVQEILSDLPEGVPSKEKMDYADRLRAFVWYKRYGDTIMPYSQGYIERTNVGKLAAFAFWNRIRYSRTCNALSKWKSRLVALWIRKLYGL